MKRVKSAKCWSVGRTLLSLTFRLDRLVPLRTGPGSDTGKQTGFQEKDRRLEGQVLGVDARLVG